MNTLHQSIQDYLTMRRDLGFKLLISQSLERPDKLAIKRVEALVRHGRTAFAVLESNAGRVTACAQPRNRQSPAQVTQVPAQISAWVGSVREEQVREGFSVLPRLHECEPNEERKGLGAEIERREPRFISDRCWAQKTEPQRMTGRPCTRACAPVPVH